ncbi:MAG: hypothetical protein M0R03_15660 [Novosphingobium sp.]|nr:hypothetical protein [Novosphingobium sp.]
MNHSLSLHWQNEYGFQPINAFGLDETLQLIDISHNAADYQNTKEFLKALPEEYHKKIYARALRYDLSAGEIYKDITHRQPGKTYLSHIAMNDVGSYWGRSDMPLLNELAEKYGIQIEYVHDYHYVTVKDQLRQSSMNWREKLLWQNIDKVPDEGAECEY